mmetsp:Transcript_87178/g.244616  ORF Transcript_87178/g.244616 Transcript_87178/m.244616 type:complete len:303 (-) Transcript_87178:131-1039(-)
MGGCSLAVQRQLVKIIGGRRQARHEDRGEEPCDGHGDAWPSSPPPMPKSREDAHRDHTPRRGGQRRHGLFSSSHEFLVSHERGTSGKGRRNGHKRGEDARPIKPFEERAAAQEHHSVSHCTGGSLARAQQRRQKHVVQRPAGHVLRAYAARLEHPSEGLQPGAQLLDGLGTADVKLPVQGSGPSEHARRDQQGNCGPWKAPVGWVREELQLARAPVNRLPHLRLVLGVGANACGTIEADAVLLRRTPSMRQRRPTLRRRLLRASLRLRLCRLSRRGAADPGEAVTAAALEQRVPIFAAPALS